MMMGMGPMMGPDPMMMGNDDGWTRSNDGYGPMMGPDPGMG